MDFVHEKLTWKKRLASSSKELKKVSSLCGCAMLTAVKLVIDSARIVISNILEISFGSLAVGVNAMYYGPILCGLAGIIADTLGFIIRPTGPYFPGFAINEFLTGFLYGCFFYKVEKITWKRVILARLSVVICISLILNPIWLHILYGTALVTTIRLIKAVVMFPIDCILLYAVLKTARRIRTNR